MNSDRVAGQRVMRDRDRELVVMPVYLALTVCECLDVEPLHRMLREMRPVLLNAKEQ